MGRSLGDDRSLKKELIKAIKAKATIDQAHPHGESGARADIRLLNAKTLLHCYIRNPTAHLLTCWVRI